MGLASWILLEGLLALRHIGWCRERGLFTLFIDSYLALTRNTGQDCDTAPLAHDPLAAEAAYPKRPMGGSS